VELSGIVLTERESNDKRHNYTNGKNLSKAFTDLFDELSQHVDMEQVFSPDNLQNIRQSMDMLSSMGSRKRFSEESRTKLRHIVLARLATPEGKAAFDAQAKRMHNVWTSKKRIEYAQTLKCIPEVLPHKAGVYQIVNTVTGHKYIGSTKDLMGRYYKHVDSFRRGNAASGMRKAISQYGFESFQFEVLEIVEDITQLRLKEADYIDKSNVPIYNARIGRKYIVSKKDRSGDPRELSQAQKDLFAWIEKNKKDRQSEVLP
jgi:hypothetical protein